ncbi:unnamed protein product [Absidia cylindrospora]
MLLFFNFYYLLLFIIMSAPTGKVYIVLYTVYHHVYKLATEVEKGLLASGVKTEMFQVQETLPDSVLTKIHAAPKLDLPVIKPEQLVDADGIMFGFPTRFGMVPSQVKGLLDGTGALWANAALHGKFAGTFFSTGSPVRIMTKFYRGDPFLFLANFSSSS